jgi:predicted  nucleic acid-binding Zn-ribbon protein
MERADEQERAMAAIDEELGSLASRRSEAESARDVALAGIEADRTTAAAGRREIASKLPADLLALYERQRARYGTGASLLRGGVSQASGVALNQDEMATVRRAAPDDVLICPSSDAILVRTGESGL